MFKLNARVCLILLALLIFSKPAYCWWSVNSIYTDTHEKTSKDALSVLSNGCPDMTSQYYFDDIWQATQTSQNDTAAHGGNPLANDGPALDWWLRALVQYKAFNFKGPQGAYWYIGQMCHLVEDMSVPAHAFDILHAPYPSVYDNFEKDAYFHYSQDSVVLQTIANVYPSDYKDYNKWNTKDVINNDLIAPPPGLTWNDYYVNNSYGPYTFPDNWPIAPEEQNLLASMLTTARNYTAGALFEASKKLPPLVKDLEIAPAADAVPVINPQIGNEISFKILENRKKAVKIFITVDSPTGEPIISSDYGTGKAFDLSSGTDLPWEGLYIVIWNGKLANGQYPSDGQHTLHVRIEDEDGNSSTDTLHHAVGVLIPFGVELQKVRFAKIDRAINNRQIVENSYVS